MQPSRVYAAITVAGAACLAVAPSRAADRDGQITIRGQTRAVWPADDLRARGFDVQDVPREENAATLYIEAINAYVDLPEELAAVFDHTHGNTWTRHPKARALADWLDQAGNRKAIDLTHQASRMDRCQIPYFGDPSQSVISVLLPALSDYRFLAKMLITDGKRLEAAGKFDRAWGNYVATYRMGGHVAQGITLIESLVGIACTASADRAMLDLVLRRKLSPDRLEGMLEEAAELAELRPTIEKGLRQERVFSAALVDEFVSRPTHLLANLQSLGQFGAGGIGSPGPTGWGALEARLGRLMLPDQTIKRHMASYFEEVDRRSQLPAYEAGWGEGWDHELIRSLPSWNIFATMLLPALSRANELSERLRANTQLTQVAAALRVYAFHHKGALPERLEGVTELLATPDALLDPFSGQWFIYRRQANGWVLYSVGEDLVDDGGKEGERRCGDYVCRFPPPAPKEFTD